MSAVPHDDRSRLAQDDSLPPGWEERRGLTFHQAEVLLDQLEACGVEQRESIIEPDGVRVRWRCPWPRVVSG